MIEGHRHTNGPEHDFEPQPGLPQTLPPGETLLWQGAPAFASLARDVFHVRKLAAYFALMLLMRVAFDLQAEVPAAEWLSTAARFAALGALGIVLVLGIAWLTARTTAYTLTDKRVVMRIGIVLSVSFNVPLARVASAALKLRADGSGHIPLALTPPDKIAWLHLWPHARGWRLAQPEPMLLSVPNAQRVAALIGEAWARVHGRAGEAVTSQPAAPVTRPVRGLGVPAWTWLAQRLAPRLRRDGVPTH